MPIPIRILQWLIDHLKFPALTTGACMMAVLLGFYLITDSFYPDELLRGLASPLEATGLFLLLSILPSYLIMCLISLVRNTPALSHSIQEILPEANHALLHKLDHTRLWPFWVLLALLFAVTENISWQNLNFEPGNERFWYSVCIVVGQIVTWAVVGLVLAVSFHNSMLLHRLGKLVDIDIYNLDSLNPFGRASLISLLMIMGALALTPLQSIDAEFRWDNYRNALLVCIPATITFMLLPTWALHRRIRKEKRKHIVAINREISSASKSLDTTPLSQLNALIDRRNYISQSRNWPMDLSIFSRIIFYVLIPPFAWTGAALMEFMLDAYLGG